MKLLLDANLSPETAHYLRSFGFDVRSLIEDHVGDLTDEEVARIAVRTRRVIVTFDLDFGEMYYFATRKKFSAIVLRLNDQRVELVNEIVLTFLQHHHALFAGKRKFLAIVSEQGVRISE